MKKILLIVALTLISVIALGQNEVFENELIRFCRYEKAYLKSDNTGIIEFSNFEVLYDKKNSIYGVQVHVAEGTKFDFILKYNKTLREGKDVLYMYEGYRKISKERSVVLTRTKLSSYTNNSGFLQKKQLRKQIGISKLSCLLSPNHLQYFLLLLLRIDNTVLFTTFQQYRVEII